MKSTVMFSGVMFIVGVLCVSVCVSGTSPETVSSVTVDDYEPRVFTSSKGETIPYRLFIPRGYDADRNYPLVLFHHGAGGSGDDNRRQFEGPLPREWAGPERQAKNPCFIVAPQIPRRESRDRENRFPRTEVMREHIQTIHEILDRLEEEFFIDTSREYVTGLSMGGECTWMSIIERPDRFAAAVPICAGDKFIGMDAAERGRKFAKFPLWIFHGDADDVISVDVSREVVKALRDAGGNPKYTEYPGVDHGSWEIAYRDPELIEWLFAQSRGTSPPPRTLPEPEESATTVTGHVQAPAMQWHKGHGTDNGDHVHYGLQTSDGGYIMTGETSEGRRGSDILVVKTDEKGDLQWQKVVGLKSKRDYANFVTEVSDGFLVAGALHDSESQKRVLLKFNSNGEIAWQKTYADDGNGEIRGIVITGDGGIVATGYVGSEQAGYRFIADDGEGFIMKTDSKGNLLWEKKFSAASHGIRVGKITGGFAIAANVWLNEGEKRHQNVCLILTDSKGEEKFSETYGGDGDDQVFDFAVTTDGGYIFSGHSRSASYGTVNWDYYLLKIGPDKKEQWHRTFGQPRGYDAKYIHDESYGVKQTPDGGYVVVGGSGDEYPYSESGRPGGPSDLWRAYVVKTDAEGNLLWQGLYGELQGNNAGEYINLTSDGGYIIFNDSDTAGSMGSNNFGLMKIAPDKGTCDN
jgi:poly(3-hydroxybutyrate) depolymerase